MAPLSIALAASVTLPCTTRCAVPRCCAAAGVVSAAGTAARVKSDEETRAALPAIERRLAAARRPTTERVPVIVLAIERRPAKERSFEEGLMLSVYGRCPALRDKNAPRATPLVY